LLGSIQFVLTSASRFSTGEDHLRAELQQVGLPREHATALAKVYQENADSIRKNLIRDSLMSKLTHTGIFSSIYKQKKKKSAKCHGTGKELFIFPRPAFGRLNNTKWI
jgi:hypothetical protein